MRPGFYSFTWDSVVRSVKMAVEWGLANRDLDGITAIGTDEICWRKRAKNKFVILVFQLDAGKKRLLWIGPNRTTEGFNNKARVITKRAVTVQQCPRLR